MKTTKVKASSFKLSALEQQIINTVRELSTDKQQFILEFSEFIKLSEFNHQTKIILEKRQAGLGKGSAWISDDFDDVLSDSIRAVD
jgi:hypothetical protein